MALIDGLLLCVGDPPASGADVERDQGFGAGKGRSGSGLPRGSTSLGDAAALGYLGGASQRTGISLSGHDG